MYAIRSYYGLDAAGRFGNALRQDRHLRNLGRGKEHGRGIRAGGDAGTAADTGRGIHGDVGINLRHQDGVAVSTPAGMSRGVAISYNFV